ncbi:DIP1984 family protein [Tepidanaerobacter acetatoxydans]|uniref:DIP1984 family protein n=1 Tax=Tepidanaerobacter acetatoxydans TaxID=499229 RepID=UPI001BD4245D|nr:DIP1984 family protein [Tepidanaerobacter acetatoxydans]
MKLAEALILRSDLQKRIEQLKNRLRNNVMVQEGEKPSEEPGVLLEELDDCLLELTDIIKRINKTNNATKFDKEWTLADALAERDKLWEKRLVLSHITEAASVKQDRYSRTEIKYISVVNVKELQKQIDKLSKEYRELDTKIQGLNWTIDLI